MRKTFVRRTEQSGDMSLQITSMADIFIIILVFLLKTYAGGSIDIGLSKGVVIPRANADTHIIEALQVEIAENHVLIDGQHVAQIQKFEFNSSDILRNGTSKSVSGAFEKKRAKQLLISKNNVDVKFDPRVIVIADQRVPYLTIKTVLASAAINGYTDFKLAVVKRD